MKSKILTLTFALVVAASSSFSQLRIGPTIGYNLDNMALFLPANQTYAETTQSTSNFNIGAKAQYDYSDQLAFTSGLVLTKTGTTISSSYTYNTGNGNTAFNDANKLSVYNIHIPINVIWKLKIVKDKGVGIVFGGGYLQYAVSGTQSYTATSSSPLSTSSYSSNNNIVFGNDATKDNLRSFDTGINFGAGYEYKNIQLTVQYIFGLRNLYPQANTTANGNGGTYALENRTLQVGLSYLLNTK